MNFKISDLKIFDFQDFGFQNFRKLKLSKLAGGCSTDSLDRESSLPGMHQVYHNIQYRAINYLIEREYGIARHNSGSKSRKKSRKKSEKKNKHQY